MGRGKREEGGRGRTHREDEEREERWTEEGGGERCTGKGGGQLTRIREKGSREGNGSGTG